MKKSVQKLKAFQKWLDKFIKRNYGKKCPEFVWSCPVCHAHFVRELFDEFVEDCVEIEDWSESKKLKKK